MMRELPEEAVDYWCRLVEAETAYVGARVALFQACRGSLSELVRSALNGEGVCKGREESLRDERGTALGVAELLTMGERQQLLDELLSVACFSQSYGQKARDIIASLPPEWLRDNLQPSAERISQDIPADDYHDMLRVCLRINREAAIGLAEKASASGDPGVRELGEDFLKRACIPE